MGNIVLLDDLTINKIAAGEVIERPASVIKEMIENSIDAGSSNINVEIKDGGISYIRVSDNGKGISKDDMEIAFERHATSKIRSAEDLDVVKSMGFRGEALASIAAIANVEMISKTADEESGYKIVVEAGKVLEMQEIGCPTGTTITVRNLFFNTPVRYKFLKKDYTESGYIEDAITRLALVNSEISFRLVNNGKNIIQTTGNGNLQDVIYSIYGKDIASAIVDVDYTYEDIHIYGMVGKPEIARSNRANQLFFVNKRYVKDKTLSSAAENSFKGLLPIGKYGFLILNVEVNPSKVDVNVHPAKLEVRFEEDNKVFKAVYHAIKDSLLKTELVANVEKEFTEENVKQTLETSNNIRPSISDLFRKISKNNNNEIEVHADNNVIEELYNKKENDINNETENEIKSEIETEVKISSVNIKNDVFKELMAMQQKLKEEAQSNPNINTNIDELINKTKNMQEGSISEINNIKEDKEIKEKTDIEEVKKENIEDNIYNIKNINNMEYKVQEEEEEYNIIGQVQENEDNIENNIEQTQEISIVKDVLGETRVFTSEEIQEMVEKLENIEDVNSNPEFANMYEKIFGKIPASIEEKKKKENEKISAYELIKDNNVSIFEEQEKYKKTEYKLVGIAFNTYIIIEIEKELYIIDQHAAHERIMYERVKENYYSDSNKDSQMLLLPDVITLTHKEMEILKENWEMFEQAGFVMDEFGENTIKLSGVPNICIDIDTKDLFMETLDEINTVARTAKQEIEEKFIATVACKAAVKANMNLNNEEVDNLMNDLLKLPNPFTCPHGRPTAIKMDQSDIEKKFARRK